MGEEEVKMEYHEWVAYLTKEPTPSPIKLDIINYVFQELYKWQKEEGKVEENIRPLKFMSLLYLIICADATVDNNNSLIDDVFTNIQAFPYGAFDIETFNILTKGICVGRKKRHELNCPDERVSKSIEKVKSINKDLINYNSFELSETVRCHYSWKYYFHKGRCSKIEPDIIKGEQKYYFKWK